MKTVTEHIRARLLCNVERIKIASYEDLVQSEWSTRFEHLMRNRLILGSFRYGRINQPDKPKWNRIKRALDELTLYQQDHNKERLVDIANMMLLEFEEGEGQWCPSDEGNIHTQEI